MTLTGCSGADKAVTKCPNAARLARIMRIMPKNSRGTHTTLKRSAESCRSRSIYWKAIRSYSDSGADRLEWAIVPPR